MKTKNLLENKKLLFWLIQFSIWTLYFFYNYKIVHRVSFERNLDQLLMVTTYITLFAYFGIPLTLISRKIIQKALSKNLKSLKLLLLVIGTSIALAHIWFLETVLLDAGVRLLGKRTIPFNIQIYMWEVFSASLLLISWNAVYTFIKLYQIWVDQKSKTAQALFMAENANLKMLRYQLNPHFLFNSLGSLRALIREDKIAAEDMLNKMTEFLRYSLTKKSDKEIPLEQELSAIKNYLDIEKTRFGDNLKVRFKIEPSAEYFPIPPFILHPIVENSVKYGMLSENKLVVEVLAEIIHNDLYIEILNSGKWYNNPKNRGTQSGISNVKDRLQLHYPNAHNFKIVKGDSFVKVKIFLKRAFSHEKKL